MLPWLIGGWMGVFVGVFVGWLAGWLVGGSLVDIVINVTNISENVLQEVGRLFFAGSIDYFGEQRQFHKLSKDLRDEDEYLSKHSVENWYEKYIDWASTNIPQDINSASKYIKIVIMQAEIRKKNMTSACICAQNTVN